MSARIHGTTSTKSESSAKETAQQNTALARAAGFAYAVIVTALFNTALALLKDAYAPLNQFMAHLTGHHWITHAIFDLLAFFAVGFLMTSRGLPRGGLTDALALRVALAVAVAAVGLGAWFLFF
jgi:hypothetical protein